MGMPAHMSEAELNKIQGLAAQGKTPLEIQDAIDKMRQRRAEPEAVSIILYLSEVAECLGLLHARPEVDGLFSPSHQPFAPRMYCPALTACRRVPQLCLRVSV